MIKNTVMLFMMTLTCFYGYSQELQNTVQVNNLNINLDTISLDNGILLENGNTTRIDKWGEKTANYEIKLFTCLNKSHYAVVYDTNTHREGGQYTRLQLHNLNGNIVFDKYFPHLTITNCYISSSGEIVVFNLSSIDAQEVHIYRNNGSLIAKYDNHDTDIYTGEHHNYFFKMKGDESNNIYDLVDKSGNISEIQFTNGFIKHIEFSKSEYYYRVIIDQDQLLYDMNHELIWKIPLNFGSINFFDKEGISISVSRGSRILEIRDLVTQEIFCSIENINYQGEIIPIYLLYTFKDYFYLVGDVKDKYVFAFYDNNCEFLHAELVKKKMPFWNYKITRIGDEIYIEDKDIIK